MSDPPQQPASRSEGHHNTLSGSAYGPVVQARDIANLHIHGAVATMPIPRQLPPAPSQFVNRCAEVGRLNHVIDGSRAVGAAPVVLLTGGHGVGKSATGKHWAHTNSERFPDGQLYADFGGIVHRGGVSVSVSDVLAGFLRALGLPEILIPVSLAERTALFRSRLIGKRFLLLLDDVEHAAQVTPLIPASADCVVLVTSRAPLEELVFDGAEVVHLAPLDDLSAEALLADIIGAERVAVEPSAMIDLARICGGLPVALRICGAQLAGPHRDKPVSWLVTRLADEKRRLGRLSRGPGHSLQAVFDDAYRGLETDAARIYRVLGMHPGPSFTSAVAAAAAEATLDEAADLLEYLFAARLIEGDGGRYRFHALLRTHARQTAERNESLKEQKAILQNTIAYYLSAARQMDHAIMPDRLRMAAMPPYTPSDEPAFSTPAEALRWFDAERANLIAAVRMAHEREWNAETWQLSEAMWIAYNNHKHFDEAREVYSLAVDAAVRIGNRDIEARMRQQLGRAEIDLKNFPAAERELDKAEGLAASSANRLLRASITEFVGVLHLDRGEYRKAVERFERSRAACEAIDYTRGVVLQEYFLGRALGAMGAHKDAIIHLRRAEMLVDRAGDSLTYGRVLIRLGEMQCGSGDMVAAAVSLTRAVEVMYHNNVPYYEALAFEGLADVYRREDNAVEEAQHLAAALAIYEALGSSRSQAISLRLEELAR